MRGATAILWLTAACGASETTALPEDDGGVVLTGAGGGAASVATSGAQTSANVAASSGTGAMDAGPPDCIDQALGEPNGAESQAFKLQPGAVEDCDDDGGSIHGVIQGSEDVDWFFYQGSDTLPCLVDPARGWVASQPGLRVCKYAFCTSAETDVGCPSGSTESTSPGGRAGCCGNAPFEIDLNCGGSFDEHAEIYLRIDHPGGDDTTCNEYDLSFHY